MNVLFSLCQFFDFVGISKSRLLRLESACLSFLALGVLCWLCLFNKLGDFPRCQLLKHQVNLYFKGIDHEKTEHDKLAFLDCVVFIEDDRSLDIKVYRNPTHADQYLFFVTHWNTSWGLSHPSVGIRMCPRSHPNRAFVKARKRCRKYREDNNDNWSTT